MRHNPEAVPDGMKIWEYFSEFRQRPELCGSDPIGWNEGERYVSPDDDDFDQMVRFVVYMASQESPHYFVSDYKSRVKVCLNAANIKQNGYVSELIINHHWWYRRTLMVYLQTFAPTEFSDWLVSKAMIYNMMEIIMERPPTDGTDRKGYVKAQADASSEVENLRGKITRLEAFLFPVDEMRQAVATQVMFDEVNTAESYARDFDNNEKFV